MQRSPAASTTAAVVPGEPAVFRSTAPPQDHLRRVALDEPLRPKPDVDAYLAAVDARLRALFAEQRCRWQRRYPQLTVGFDAVESFVLCGGKRLRPRFAYWGWVGAEGEAPEGRPWDPALVDLGAAIELFHAFALIHDDVMDGSETRRHQPTVHERFAATHRATGWRGEPRRTAEGFAILLGDLAFAYSSHLLVGMAEPVAELFDTMRIELHVGQYLDLMCATTGDDDPAVAADVVRFKTAKYSVERPLHLGAALAGHADPLPCWTAYGIAVGEAFQHRDDLLGVFGDPALTGKPVGDDLQAGKNTLLLQQTRRAPGADGLEPLGRVGSGTLTEHDVAAIAEFMRRCGAVDAVEARIARLVGDALAVLRDAPIAPPARFGLEDLARTAAWRAR